MYVNTFATDIINVNLRCSATINEKLKGFQISQEKVLIEILEKFK